MTEPTTRIKRMTESAYLHGTEEFDGYCLACRHTTHGGIEPDAHDYVCERCSQPQVFGLEELLMMGLIEIR